MPKSDEPAVTAAKKEPTREEALAATEAANAARAIEGHVVVHVDPAATSEAEK